MKKSKKNKELGKQKFVPELKLVYKSTLLKKNCIEDAEQAAKLLRKIFEKGTIEVQEEMILLLLDENDRPIGFYRLAKGTKDRVFYSEHDVLRVLLLSNCSAFITAHNHPNGGKYPSDQDTEMAFSLKVKTNYLGIEYRDNIILTKKDHFSYLENKLFWDYR